MVVQRSGDDELAERLKAFIMHLRRKDPQFATQDAMDEALEQGLFSTAAKVRTVHSSIALCKSVGVIVAKGMSRWAIYIVCC